MLPVQSVFTYAGDVQESETTRHASSWACSPTGLQSITGLWKSRCVSSHLLFRIRTTRTIRTSSHFDFELLHIRFRFILCRLPVKVGSCRASFPRFFYDVTNQTCSSFVYGGCESNGNNFNTLEECESTCSGVSGKIQQTPRSHCEAELQVGPCRAAFRRWYYNREAGSCQQFTYGGCKGNKNNYVSEEHCVATCSGEYCTLNESSKCSVPDHCLVGPDPGPCRAAFPMFYYNPDSASCQSFMYGGCQGNENRYGSVEECMSRCSEDGKRLQPVKPEEPPGFMFYEEDLWSMSE
uniref:BPTI/Kunitz inhibitor domain-containing protein n=1 Tax=Stegastes partitus TaxID=144197 RepID=A0A3B5AJP1_9TELE